MVKVLMWLAVAAFGLVGAPENSQAQTAAQFSEIEAGPFHACGRAVSGAVLCWGANDQGQLGSGRTRDRRYARPVRGIWSATSAIGVGESHSCAIAAQNRLRCWGRNAEGQLGDGTQAARLIAGPVGGPRRRFTAVAGGFDHSCALAASTRVLCWGGNATGAVGDGTTQTRLVPTLVSGLPRGQVEIGTGYLYSCARSDAGAVSCWGSNAAGRLGNGQPGDSGTPVPVTGLNAGAEVLSVGVNHACAVAAGGVAVCWGANDYGQIGNGSTTDLGVAEPLPVAGLPEPVSLIEAGGTHSCAVAGADGAVWCWGYNIHGQLGDGTTTDSPVPVAVQGLTGTVVSLSLGDLYSCVLMADGIAHCWGSNDRGQLGVGTRTASSVPMPVLRP